MRLFVGVTLGDAVVGAALDAAEQLRRQLPTGFVARWVPRENMHLTVRFIGHVAEAGVPSLLDVLRPSLPLDPFDVALGSCGAFPPSGPPRVIWIGIDAGFESLRAMHEEFDRRVEALGYVSEKRPFTVHLTLARVTHAPPASARRVREAVAAYRPQPARWHVDGATIFESRLSPKGPTYQRLFDVACAR